MYNMEKYNLKVMFGLTIIMNTIAILLILNQPNPWLLIIIAALFLTPPTVMALVIEEYLKIAIDDERRELIANESSLNTIDQYIILSTIIGTILLLGSEIVFRLNWSNSPFTPIYALGIIVITTGLIVGWVFIFTTDFQIKLIDGTIFKVRLKDLIYVILSSLLIILYINHVSLLATDFDKSFLSELFDVEKNWLVLYFLFFIFNLLGLKKYSTIFGSVDERMRSIKQMSSSFTLQLVNMILLTFSLLLLIMSIISFDEDLLVIGVPFFLTYSFLKGNYLINIQKAGELHS